MLFNEMMYPPLVEANGLGWVVSDRGIRGERYRDLLDGRAGGSRLSPE